MMMVRVMVCVSSKDKNYEEPIATATRYVVDMSRRVSSSAVCLNLFVTGILIVLLT